MNSIRINISSSLIILMILISVFEPQHHGAFAVEQVSDFSSSLFIVWFYIQIRYNYLKNVIVRFRFHIRTLIIYNHRILVIIILRKFTIINWVNDYNLRQRTKTEKKDYFLYFLTMIKSNNSFWAASHAK